MAVDVIGERWLVFLPSWVDSVTVLCLLDHCFVDVVDCYSPVGLSGWGEVALICLNWDCHLDIVSLCVVLVDYLGYLVDINWLSGDLFE